MARKEKDFQTEFGRGVSALSRKDKRMLTYHKIVDTGFTRNPYDCFVVSNGLHYACELKINKAINTFNFKSFFREREHEITALYNVERAGGKAYVIINHFIPRKVNTAYVVSVKFAEDLFYGKGSCKTDEIMNNCIAVLEKSKETINTSWDLSQIL